LTFVDGVDIIARLNGSCSGQDAELTSDAISRRLASEVCAMGFPLCFFLMILCNEVVTIEYVRSETSIPVPKVYHAVTDHTNPVGTCYTLQERVGFHPYHFDSILVLLIFPGHRPIVV
jgi:hypothetical protein